MRTFVTGPGAAKDDLVAGSRAKRKNMIRANRRGMLDLFRMAVVGVVITLSSVNLRGLFHINFEIQYLLQDCHFADFRKQRVPPPAKKHHA
jgi:hypothetical protein